jgi:hypothetical protein
MSLKVWIKILGVATVIALVYIHMQMQIFHLAYQGSKREKQVLELRDKNGLLTHQILALKSANHLGNKLLDKEGNTLQFMGSEHILTLKGPASIAAPGLLPVKPKGENTLWNFLTFLAPREAKAWDRRKID